MRRDFTTILAIAVCAVLAGGALCVAIAEWARDLGHGVRVRLALAMRPAVGVHGPPGLRAVDIDELD